MGFQAAAEDRAKFVLEDMQNRRRIIQDELDAQTNMLIGLEDSMDSLCCSSEAPEPASMRMQECASPQMAHSRTPRPQPRQNQRQVLVGTSVRNGVRSASATPTTTTAPATNHTTIPNAGTGTSAVDVSAQELDYTKLPQMLDVQFEKLDTDAALRPTTIKLGNVWDLESQAGLLSKPAKSQLRADEQQTAKQAAFDLIDALTRSGALAIDAASFHVVLVATHCFDTTLIETVIQKNVNPIEKVERSVLIVASTVLQQPVEALVQSHQLARLHQTSPELFGDAVVAAKLA
jgi:hypothetical protein